MKITIETPDLRPVERLVGTLERHPFGTAALVTIILLLVVALAIFAWRF